MECVARQERLIGSELQWCKPIHTSTRLLPRGSHCQFQRTRPGCSRLGYFIRCVPLNQAETNTENNFMLLFLVFRVFLQHKLDVFLEFSFHENYRRR